MAVLPQVQNLLLCESISEDNGFLTLHKIINSFSAQKYPAGRECFFFLALSGGRGFVHLFINLVNLENGGSSDVHVGGFDFADPIKPTILSDKFTLQLHTNGAYELRVFARHHTQKMGRLIHTFSFTATKLEKK